MKEEKKNIIDGINGLIEENEQLKKQILQRNHDIKNVAYQMAEMAGMLRMLSEQMTTLATTINGGPLTQLESLRMTPLSQVERTKAKPEPTERQLAGRAQAAETRRRKKEEAEAEAARLQAEAEAAAKREAKRQQRREAQLRWAAENPEAAKARTEKMRQAKARKKALSITPQNIECQKVVNG